MTSREVRRVVTGLDEDGRSTVATDGPPAVALDAHAIIWEIATPPGGDVGTDCPEVPAPGVIRMLRRVIPPCASTRLHQTSTVDVVYVAEGTVELLLEAEPVVLRTGDFLVDRAHVHGWRNRGDVPCTLIALMYGLDAGAQATEAGER